MIKKVIIILLFLIVLLPSHAIGNDTDSALVCNIIGNLSVDEESNENYILALAQSLLGLPYVSGTLEVNDEERLVVNLRQLDCTTFVENVLALSQCVKDRKNIFEAFKQKLEMIRYRNGELQGYESRLHYFSDWIEDNKRKGFVFELQGPNPPFTQVQMLNLNFMSTHPRLYKALRNNPHIVQRIEEQENLLSGSKYNYIPKSMIKNTVLLRNTIKDGDIIAIVCNKPGLDIAHVGLAIWKPDGLHMLHASSTHKKVIEDKRTLYDYLSKNKSFLGIRVIRACK